MPNTLIKDTDVPALLLETASRDLEQGPSNLAVCLFM